MGDYFSITVLTNHGIVLEAAEVQVPLDVQVVRDELLSNDVRESLHVWAPTTSAHREGTGMFR